MKLFCDSGQAEAVRFMKWPFVYVNWFHTNMYVTTATNISEALNV